ncbi:MAG: glycosyltransferase family 2 protein [Actinobacteria bacterium]|nr:glycosyltransferase family 2 protein [Cyanobacteriota bacterium]MCL5771830.1 glycosyltransferase family 2 protein [Actinomycetota bacterium]
MENKKYNISAFFPVYNDWGTIPSMVLLAEKALKKVAANYEIILIDDDSNNLTKSVLEALSKKIENLKIITHEKNKGYGGALKSGFYNAKYELIFYTDGDAQYNPLELEKLVEKMTDYVDIVNGYKISRQDPFYRKIIGRLYHYTTKILFKFKIRDVDCDFRLIRKSLFDNINLRYDSGIICVEMISKFAARGARFVEVPVTHYFRVSGKSQFFNFKRIFRTGVHLLKLWYQIRIKNK